MGFLDKVADAGGRRFSKAGESRTKTVMIYDYEDQDTAIGGELILKEDGQIDFARDANGDYLKLRFRMAPPTAETSDNRPEISDLYCQTGDIQAFVDQMVAEYQKIQNNQRSMVVGEMLKDLHEAMDPEENLTMDGFVRKHNRIVEPGGVVQFDGCENKGEYYEVNWLRTLANRQRTRLIVPQRSAHYTIYPPKVYVMDDAGNNRVMSGEKALAALNAMTSREAADRAVIDVDLVLTKLAVTTRVEPEAMIKDRLAAVLALGASRGAGVKVRILREGTPVYDFKMTIGSKETELVDDQERKIHHIRTPEEALERHLAEERAVSADTTVTNAEFYQLLKEDGAEFEITPCICTALSPMEKASLTKDEDLPGDALLSVATIEKVQELDEEGNPIIDTVTNLSGVDHVPRVAMVQLYGVLTNAALSVQDAGQEGYRPALRYMNYYKPNPKTPQTKPHLFRFIQRAGSDSNAPILKVAGADAPKNSTLAGLNQYQEADDDLGGSMSSGGLTL